MDDVLADTHLWLLSSNRDTGVWGIWAKLVRRKRNPSTEPTCKKD